MKHFGFVGYPRKGEDRNELPEDIKAIRNKAWEIYMSVSALSEDTGWKDGVKSTSYNHQIERVSCGGWDADCESMKSISVDGQRVARMYDCHGNGFFEFLNEKTINKLHEMICTGKEASA